MVVGGGLIFICFAILDCVVRFNRMYVNSPGRSVTEFFDKDKSQPYSSTAERVIVSSEFPRFSTLSRKLTFDPG